jgi:hypothetical protein
LTVRETRDDGLNPYNRGVLHGSTVVPFFAAVKPDGLITGQAARMVGVAAHKTHQCRGLGGKVGGRSELVVGMGGHERAKHEHFIFIDVDLAIPN